MHQLINEKLADFLKLQQQFKMGTFEQDGINTMVAPKLYNSLLYKMDYQFNPFFQ